MGETSQPGGVCGAADKIKNVINLGIIQVRKQGRDLKRLSSEFSIYLFRPNSDREQFSREHLVI